MSAQVFITQDLSASHNTWLISGLLPFSSSYVFFFYSMRSEHIHNFVFLKIKNLLSLKSINNFYLV